MPVGNVDEQMVLEGFGGQEKSVTLGVVKHRFFMLGLQIGAAGEMFFMSVIVMILSSDEESGAIYELSHEYYPLFRGLFLICFFSACYGCILFTWKRCHIDYNEIFGVGLQHNYHFVIRISLLLMFLVFTMFILYVFTLIGSSFRNYKHVWPAAAMILFIFILLSPFNLFEWNGRSQRYSLLLTICKVLVSPFTKATFNRTFIADVFTSMPKIFSDILFTSCIYVTGEAFDDKWVKGHSIWTKHDDDYCTSSNYLYFAVHLGLSCLPFWVRLMQCIRGYVDTHAIKHVANALKYTMSLTVVLLSVVSKTYYTVWLSACVASSCYCYFWDLHMDWGIGVGCIRRALHGKELGRCAGYALLRKQRRYPKRFYYIAMASNAAARMGWALYISPGQPVFKQHFILLLGCVELLRRAQWAVFRLEWEEICRCNAVLPAVPSVQLTP